MSAIKNGTLETISGDLVFVTNRDEKTILGFRLIDEPTLKPGDEVHCRVLWGRGWEGNGAEIRGRDGTEHRAHLALYVVGNSISEIAENLNLDEDSIALGIAGVRTAE